MKYLFVLIIVLFSLSCSRGNFQEGRKFIGNKSVSVDTLNMGQQLYIENCSACHGLKGDGNGPAAMGSVPPPRNFKQGLYKFGLVADSGLPTDKDFKRIIQKGLHGTAMIPWVVSDTQANSIIQYIKTFSKDVWENKENSPGTPIKLIKNPYVANRKFAVKKGKEVYHITGQCQACHRAYATKPELNAMSMKVNNEPLTDFDDEMYDLKLQESEYYYHDSEDRLAKFLPPDFTWHEVRSAKTIDELAYRIAAGVTGTGMPAWKDVITDREIWAVAYYVKSLMKLRGKPERNKLINSLK